MWTIPFDCVVKALKYGRKCARESWGIKDKYIYLNLSENIKTILVYNYNNDYYNYNASSEDILATDWYILEEN
jgi:hypothetical protein